jgi:hypothetical protein
MTLPEISPHPVRLNKKRQINTLLADNLSGVLLFEIYCATLTQKGSYWHKSIKEGERGGKDDEAHDS